MFAMLESTSSAWAREMRGTASMAMPVTPALTRHETRSGSSRGDSRLMRVVPLASLAISAGVGALILVMMSDFHTATPLTMVAPSAA